MKERILNEEIGLKTEFPGLESVGDGVHSREQGEHISAESTTELGPSSPNP